MIRKVLLILFISTLLISCGKKNCPKINEEDKCREFFQKS